jgi:hypothetical protein
MKEQTTMNCLRTTLSILALCGLVACGADDGTDDHAGTSAATAQSLALSAERATFLPYQRIVLSARYQGSIAPLLAPEAGEVSVHVDGPGRENYTLQPLALHCAGIETEPRASSALIDVTADGSGWVFATSGSYRVTLHGRGGDLVSAPLTITIVEATTPEDVRARDLIRESANFPNFQHFDGGDRHQAELALTTALAEGASSYREDMRDLLVRHYSRQSVTNDGLLRAPMPEKALAYYDRASGAAKTFSKATALRYLRRLQGMGQAPAALDVQGELELLERRAPEVRFQELQGARLSR